jgi:hypothetical protein
MHGELLVEPVWTGSPSTTPSRSPPTRSLTTVQQPSRKGQCAARHSSTSSPVTKSLDVSYGRQNS